MKQLSVLGNTKLLNMFKEQPELIEQRRRQAFEHVKAKGGHRGQNNPHYGRAHTLQARDKMKEAAKTRDNTNIGKYVRTTAHRNMLSVAISSRIQSGKMFRSRDTKPELLFEQLLQDMGVTYTKQFLVQEKFQGQPGCFRHAYDFYIPSHNLLVEVDGNYWHSRPEVKERDTMCSDKAREKGFTLVRFLQSEIENDSQSVKRRLLDTLRSSH